ncbi:histidinol-phosphate transaminase [Terrihalobacillus insolitus]|uniref:histidinol-phosphate transaminase n=1 Tax=Terrihalobacillus insolitus TaxID=2950438 RepID=UPI0023420261|nr:histidinol-phosphate transaminase [Terrihalobacillus insolitus]MDC3413048.1 histidinol-phosphate transaminase [Terrihalobacillus insolitus]
MKAKEILNELKPYKPGKQMEDVKREFGLERIVKLASNENPFGFSPKVKAELPKLIENFQIYPDGYTGKLREALASKLGVRNNQLVFGGGSDEVIQIICRSYLQTGTNTIMATPTFSQYKQNAVLEGTEIREVPLENGYHNLDKMLQTVDHQTRVVWLCSPNNPTGCHINQEDFYRFMDKIPHDVLVVVDEAYYEYVEANDFPDTIAALQDYPNLIVLRTFSKAYGLAGLRIGYGIANEAIIAKLDVVRGPFNTSSVAQQAALLALEDEEFLQHSVERNKENKQAFIQFCDQLGLSYYDSQTNFLLVQLPVSGDQVFQHLLSKGFIVRSGEALGVPNSVRITIGEREDMENLQKKLKEYLTLNSDF